MHYVCGCVAFLLGGMGKRVGRQVFRTEDLVENRKREGEHKRKRLVFKIPLQEEGLPKLMFQILLPDAEPSVKDALAIFLSIQKEVCKQ